MSSQVVLIFGYGPRIGAAVARAFANRGYKVAVVCRSDKVADTPDDYLSIKADLSNAYNVEDVFTQVRSKLGIPSVVVYNAFILSIQGFEQPLSSVITDAHVNTFSAYAAAQQAVKGFAELPPDASKTFIYTSNKLHIMTLEPLISMGMGKSASAHMIHYLSEVYRSSGYKFYHTDERESDGEPAYDNLDAEAHANYYIQLVEEKDQGPWNATFVKGKGYVKFDENPIHGGRFPGA
ncbi:NAD(P)-binding protein [Trichoderma sp. SZMC 28013]